MELSQIAYFVTLARTLHFTRAAEACNVSQPALTKAVQKLEEELGGPLLHRERGNTQLTELGRLMLPPLERALALAREAKQQAEAFRQRESSPLRIGLEYSVPASLLTPVLAALRRKCEHIDLRLRQGSQADLCQRMLDSELDIALMVDGPGIQERLHRWPLFAEHYIVYARRSIGSEIATTLRRVIWRRKTSCCTKARIVRCGNTLAGCTKVSAPRRACNILPAARNTSLRWCWRRLGYHSRANACRRRSRCCGARSIRIRTVVT